MKRIYTPRERHDRDNGAKKRWRHRNAERQANYERLHYIKRTVDLKLARIEKFEQKIRRIQARIDYLKDQLKEVGAI